MVAADTNVLVRIFTADDPEQTKRARRFVASGAWVSHLVLVETLWVLVSVYEQTKHEISHAVEMLLSNESIILQEAETVAAALKSFNEAKGVSFSDCLILAVARKAGHKPLGTFDTKLAKVDGAVLL